MVKKYIVDKGKIVAEITDVKDFTNNIPMILSGPNVPERPKTKLDKELDASAKKWEQYYKDNRGKIPGTMPKSIFDPDKENET